MRPADAIGLVTVRLHPCASKYLMLQLVNCRPNRLSVNRRWPKIELLLYLFILILSCGIYTLQYTAFSRYNSIQTCSGNCMLTHHCQDPHSQCFSLHFKLYIVAWLWNILCIACIQVCSQTSDVSLESMHAQRLLYPLTVPLLNQVIPFYGHV